MSETPANTRPNTQQRRNGGEKKPRKTVVMLLSCCLFLLIVSSCLLAALVLIGKHFVYNSIQAQKGGKVGFAKEKRAIQHLPQDVIPFHYDLTLMPNLETGEFKGKVNITLEILSARSNLMLHSKNLSIDTVELMNVNKSVMVQVQNVEDSPLDEMIKIVTKEVLPKGVYHVALKYSGSMLNRIVGLYMSHYRNEAKQSRTIATSKFEPTYARQAFPCFDEPNMKATYKVHLLRPNTVGYSALSNMPVELNETQPDGNVLVHFQESVKMSTYLVCFIVSDFEYTEDLIKDKITFRVYATPAQLEKTNYAREIGKNVIEYYIDYFGIEYPLPKLDMAAIPDFVSGAMEHWGLVTYRETALLYSDSTHSSTNKQRVATVVAHELAHSWFGNLVTMNWWNDLWLNEGFATYIEYKGVDFCEPDWQMLDQFLVAELHPVLKLDAKLSSHPIVQTVTTPDEITAIFDTISYSKGASILRMLEDAVGETVFQEGVTNYLKNHAFDHAVTQDLLDEIQKIRGDELNVTEFMNTWTVQLGYPVVTLKEDGDNYVLTQTQYLTDQQSSEKPDSSPYNYKWTIPITYISDLNPEPVYHWFKHTDESLTIPKPSGVKWVKFNYKQVGYYRVNYEPSAWEALTENYNELLVADRTHLLEESFRLAESGNLNYSVPLKLVQRLKEETNYLPWRVTSTMVEQITQYLTASQYLANFQDFVKDIVQNAYANLTWTETAEDSHLTRRARVVVLDLACSMGHSTCLQEASDKFVDWLEKGTTLSQDLRTLVYNYGMTAGTSDQWYKLWDKFVAETDANEKLKLLNGLASIKDTVLLTRLLVLAEDETYIRSQDYFTCVKYIAGNPIGEPIVWNYVRENWEILVKRFGLNDRYLGQLIPSITASFSSTTKLEEMRAFFEKYPDAGAGASYRVTALETVSNNIKWLSKYKDDVEEVVKTYSSS